MKSILFATALSAVVSMPAHAFDLRDCPVNRVTFVEEGGATFQPDRVGLTRVFLCGDGVARPKPVRGDDMCREFGDTILRGILTENDRSSRQVFYTYSVIDGSPCCSWEEGVHPAMKAKVQWSKGFQKLRSLGFLSIEPGLNSQPGESADEVFFPIACANQTREPFLTKGQ